MNGSALLLGVAERQVAKAIAVMAGAAAARWLIVLGGGAKADFRKASATRGGRFERSELPSAPSPLLSPPVLAVAIFYENPGLPLPALNYSAIYLLLLRFLAQTLAVSAHLDSPLTFPSL